MGGEGEKLDSTALRLPRGEVLAHPELIRSISGAFRR